VASEGEITRKGFLGRATLGVAGLGLAGPLAASQAAGAKSSAAKVGTAGAPYNIVHCLNLSGVQAQDAADSRDGAALAINEINAAGGVAGRPIKHSSIDTDIFTPQGTLSAFTKAVSLKPDAITTHYLFAQEGALKATAAYGAPYLNGNTSVAEVNLVKSNPSKYRMVFQCDPTEVPYGPGIIPFLDATEATGTWTPKKHTIFIVVGSDAYDQAIAKGLQDAAKKSGKWKVVGVEKVVSPVKDWGPQLAKIRAAKPDAIALIDYIDTEAAAFMTQFVAQPTKSLVYIQYAPSSPKFIQLAGKAANGVTWATTAGTYHDQIGLDFIAKFRKAYKREPVVAFAGMHYDMVYMLAHAWGIVGDSRNFNAVCKQLRETIHRGVNGGYDMNRPGQYVLSYPTETSDPSLGQAHLFFQIQNGKQKVVSPKIYAGGAYQRPSWA
jgi:branched-chain amino acid transport system substrate-binding protein